jgi:hypothetical protein
MKVEHIDTRDRGTKVSACHQLIRSRREPKIGHDVPTKLLYQPLIFQSTPPPSCHGEASLEPKLKNIRV